MYGVSQILTLISQDGKGAQVTGLAVGLSIAKFSPGAKVGIPGALLDYIQRHELENFHSSTLDTHLTQIKCQTFNNQQEDNGGLECFLF